MSVGLDPPQALIPVRGVSLAATAAGIKKNGETDMVLLALAGGTQTAATFTRNAFSAAPVTVAREHLSRFTPRAWLINSGNANAGTGQQGLADARASCEAVARALGIDSGEVMPFSTGVIGEYLPMQRVQEGVRQLSSQLNPDAWLDAAKGIMTTDTVAKGVSRTVELSDATVTITGIAKGSGMIHPDMATMLAFLATDVHADRAWLQKSLGNAVDVSFNCVTVDGDTSTNDACVIAATGACGGHRLDGSDADSEVFAAALREVCTVLAQAIIRDGEGASKFVTVRVDGANSTDEARRVGFTIAHSPLVKTALFASDPNWGRILAAVGRAGVEDLDIDAVRLFLDDVCIVSRGGRDAGYTEGAGQRVMLQDEITVRVELGRGSASATLWTSDLSHEYVKINAEYRT